MKNQFYELSLIRSGPRLKWLLSVACGLLASISIQAQPNLVLNGGFETGDLTGWTPSSVADVEVDTAGDQVVHSGTYGAYFGPVGSLGYISQTLNTIPGGRYLISAWVHSEDGETPNEFNITWEGANLFDAFDLPIDWTSVMAIYFTQPTSTGGGLSY